MEGTIAVFIPIIFIMVTGLVIITAVYLKSREKQIMIEKGLSAEQMIELLRTREKSSRNNFYLLKGGIVTIFLVIGGIIGNMIDRAFFTSYEVFDGHRIYDNDPVYGVWVAFLGLGIGAVVAHFVALKAEKANSELRG